MNSPSKKRKRENNSVQVAVRVRPLNYKEIKRKEKICIQMRDDTTIIIDPSSGEEKKYTFDYSYWSMEENQEENNPFANQETVFKDLGKAVVSQAFDGYNSCVFAYGQTGSGKSYTQYGSPSSPGIIPRLCEELFREIELRKESASESEIKNYRVEVSMMEIYNEKVRDLFNPSNPRNESGLKVRENPRSGPYVPGLTMNIAKNYKELELMLEEGSKLRTIGSTSMNDRSSRAHTIFQIIFTQQFQWGKKKKQENTLQGKEEDSSSSSTGVERVARRNKKKKLSQRVSKINIIDLAGSERQGKAQTEGKRLKEGCAINLSLSMLGNVINKLAEIGKGKVKDDYVPYRNSKLTWLLKESLGGNSKTVMIATISPAATNYAESLSTLKYANRAKDIQNHAKVNEDAQSKLINELRKEIKRLKALLLEKQKLKMGSSSISSEEQETIKQEQEQLILQLEESERIVQQLEMTDEERIEQTQNLAYERKCALEAAGVSAAYNRKEVPHIVNLNEDASMSESLIYFFKPDAFTRIGNEKEIDSYTKNEIVLSGSEIQLKHCVVENELNEKVYLMVEGDSVVFVNGKRVGNEERIQLRQNDRIILGKNQVFRFQNPNEEQQINNNNKDRRSQKEVEVIDWSFAVQELEHRMKESFEQERKKKEEKMEEEFEMKREVEVEKIKELVEQRQLLKETVMKLQQENEKKKLEQISRLKVIQGLETDVNSFQQLMEEEMVEKERLEDEGKEQKTKMKELKGVIDFMKKEVETQKKETQRIESAHLIEKRELEAQTKELESRLTSLKGELKSIEDEQSAEEEKQMVNRAKLGELKGNVQNLEETLKKEALKKEEMMKKSELLAKSEQEWKEKVGETEQMLKVKTQEHAQLLPVIQKMIINQNSVNEKRIALLEQQSAEQRKEIERIREENRKKISEAKQRQLKGESGLVEKLLNDMEDLMNENSSLKKEIKNSQPVDCLELRSSVYIQERQVEALKRMNEKLAQLAKERKSIISALRNGVKKLNENYGE